MYHVYHKHKARYNVDVNTSEPALSLYSRRNSIIRSTYLNTYQALIGNNEQIYKLFVKVTTFCNAVHIYSHSRRFQCIFRNIIRCYIFKLKLNAYLGKIVVAHFECISSLLVFISCI